MSEARTRAVLTEQEREWQGRARSLRMGLDVANRLFGNFHLNWAGTRWFSNWCEQNGLPDPFIAWGGDNSGDQCRLGAGEKVNSARAKAWCKALDETHPDLAEMGRGLLAQPPVDLHAYLCPEPRLGLLEWERRAIACWYAILRHGLESGDTLEYW